MVSVERATQAECLKVVIQELRGMRVLLSEYYAERARSVGAIQSESELQNSRLPELPEFPPTE